MRIFLTGATGFIGSAIIPELTGAGHTVLGLARNEAAGEALQARGVEPHRGELADTDSLVAGARACDGTIHCAFIHDFSRYAENIETDRRAVEATLGALERTGKPFILSSGLAMLAPGRMASENDDPADQGRGATELVTRKAAERGVRSVAIRLPPSVHGEGDKGFLAWLVEAARRTGVSAYVGDGQNRWSAVHRLDAARLYRLALERGAPGSAYHAAGDEGVPTRAIAEVIAGRLGLPLASKTSEEASADLGFIGFVFSLDLPASAALTRERLSWSPREAGLISDFDAPRYFAGGEAALAPA